jgi:hypothetical protein
MSVTDELIESNRTYADAHRDRVRGFVYEVESGRLREVA